MQTPSTAGSVRADPSSSGTSIVVNPSISSISRPSPVTSIVAKSTPQSAPDPSHLQSSVKSLATATAALSAAIATTSTVIESLDESPLPPSSGASSSVLPPPLPKPDHQSGLAPAPPRAEQQVAKLVENWAKMSQPNSYLQLPGSKTSFYKDNTGFVHVIVGGLPAWAKVDNFYYLHKNEHGVFQCSSLPQAYHQHLSHSQTKPPSTTQPLNPHVTSNTVQNQQQISLPSRFIDLTPAPVSSNQRIPEQADKTRLAKDIIRSLGPLFGGGKRKRSHKAAQGEAREEGVKRQEFEQKDRASLPTNLPVDPMPARTPDVDKLQVMRPSIQEAAPSGKIRELHDQAVEPGQGRTTPSIIKLPEVPSTSPSQIVDPVVPTLPHASAATTGLSQNDAHDIPVVQSLPHASAATTGLTQNDAHVTPVAQSLPHASAAIANLSQNDAHVTSVVETSSRAFVLPPSDVQHAPPAASQELLSHAVEHDAANSIQVPEANITLPHSPPLPRSPSPPPPPSSTSTPAILETIEISDTDMEEDETSITRNSFKRSATPPGPLQRFNAVPSDRSSKEPLFLPSPTSSPSRLSLTAAGDIEDDDAYDGYPVSDALDSDHASREVTSESQLETTRPSQRSKQKRQQVYVLVPPPPEWVRRSRQRGSAGGEQSRKQRRIYEGAGAHETEGLARGSRWEGMALP